MSDLKDILVRIEEVTNGIDTHRLVAVLDDAYAEIECLRAEPEGERTEIPKLVQQILDGELVEQVGPRAWRGRELRKALRGELERAYLVGVDDGKGRPSDWVGPSDVPAFDGVLAHLLALLPAEPEGERIEGWAHGAPLLGLNAGEWTFYEDGPRAHFSRRAILVLFTDTGADG
jgi:hypothetical protein